MGLTVIVKVFVAPAQPTRLFVKIGVTNIVATTGAVLALTAANDAMFPVPDPSSPMPGTEFVHAYVVTPPPFNVVKLTAVELAPLHIAWFAG